MSYKGFLQRSKQLRDEYEKVPDNYELVLGFLMPIASKNNNSLPTMFTINYHPEITVEILQDVLTKLYPECRYICTSFSNDISCYRC